MNCSVRNQYAINESVQSLLWPLRLRRGIGGRFFGSFQLNWPRVGIEIEYLLQRYLQPIRRGDRFSSAPAAP
ncbi:hypothetical protein ABH975_002736 [Bradyrhizobium ottawaense]